MALQNVTFGVSAGDIFEAPLIAVGYCRVGDPHSEKRLKTDLHEERMRSGAEGWVRTLGRGGGGPTLLLPFLSGQMFYDPTMTFLSQCVSGRRNSEVHKPFCETAYISPQWYQNLKLILFF